MRVQSKHFRSVWEHSGDPAKVCVIDQRFLPHEFRIAELMTAEDAFYAIQDMQVRGAPLIGVTAAFGMYLAALHAPEKEFDLSVQAAAKKLLSARPTAVNLRWAVQEQIKVLRENLRAGRREKISAFLEKARQMAEDDIAVCAGIGDHGLLVIKKIYEEKRGGPVRILTHCNAGWLACVDWGTATAPIYKAYDEGIPVHVWVDETRPRNQGAALTAWELEQHGVAYTLVPDNAGGHLMQHGKVDLVLVGTDRTTRTGDAANKIGTYLKALAAKAHGVPFYVAAPSSSIDWSLRSGLEEIPIEERSQEEVKYVSGLCDDGTVRRVLICPAGAKAANFGFDVTPRECITGLITERGIAPASEEGLLSLFPEKAGLVS